jgi:hypothetical protein
VGGKVIDPSVIALATEKASGFIPVPSSKREGRRAL